MIPRRSHSCSVWLPALLGAAVLAAQPAPEAPPVPRVYPPTFFGPVTLLAGYRTIFQFKPDYTFNFECSPATDRCRTTGYIPSNGEIGTLSTSNTLPEGLYSLVQNRFPTYAICAVMGDTFRLFRNDCTGTPEDIQSPGTGTHTFFIYNWRRQRIFLDSAPAGFPEGSQFEFRTVGAGYACNTPAPQIQSKIYRPAGGDSSEGTLCMLVTVPATAPSGRSTASLRTCQDMNSSNCSLFQFPIDVTSVPETALAGPPSFPPIPGLAKWQKVMKATGSEAGAGTYCRDRSNPSEVFKDMPEASVAYYDGIKMYSQIAAYTKDPSWNNCALNLAKYSTEYIVSNRGQIPAYKIFCEGMARMAEQNPSLEPAVRLLASTTYLQYGTLPRMGSDREIAYALSTSVCLSQHYGMQNRFREDFRDTLHGFLLKYTEPGAADRGDSQTFYLGLMAKALIEDAEDDPRQRQRALYTIRRTMQRIADTYNPKTHSVMYATGKNASPWCLNEPLWFHGDPYSGCQQHKGQKLQSLVAPMFAWYWSLTGEAFARTFGDELFSHAVEADAYTGKEVAQVFFWTFDYVRWRSGPQQAR
jgi:hypothetical protein